MKGVYAIGLACMAIACGMSVPITPEESSGTKVYETLLGAQGKTKVAKYQNLNAIWPFLIKFDNYIDSISVEELRGSNAFDTIDKYAVACGRVCTKATKCNGFAVYYGEYFLKNECRLLMNGRLYTFSGPYTDIYEGDYVDSVMTVFLAKTAKCKDGWFGFQQESKSESFVLQDIGCHDHIEIGSECANDDMNIVDIQSRNHGCAKGTKCSDERVEGYYMCDSVESLKLYRLAETEEKIRVEQFKADYQKGVYNYSGLVIKGFKSPAQHLYAVRQPQLDLLVPVSNLMSSSMYHSASAFASACAEACIARGDNCIGFVMIYSKSESFKNQCMWIAADALREGEYYHFEDVREDGELPLPAENIVGYLFVPEQYNGCEDGMYLGYQRSVGYSGYGSWWTSGCREFIRVDSDCGSNGDKWVDATRDNSGCARGLQCMSLLGYHNPVCKPHGYEAQYDYVVIGALITKQKVNAKRIERVRSVKLKNQIYVLDYSDRLDQSLYDQGLSCARACDNTAGCRVFQYQFDLYLCVLASTDRVELLHQPVLNISAVTGFIKEEMDYKLICNDPMAVGEMLAFEVVDGKSIVWLADRIIVDVDMLLDFSDDVSMSYYDQVLACAWACADMVGCQTFQYRFDTYSCTLCSYGQAVYQDYPLLIDVHPMFTGILING
eukprot:CFRG6356T1